MNSNGNVSRQVHKIDYHASEFRINSLDTNVEISPNLKTADKLIFTSLFI